MTDAADWPSPTGSTSLQRDIAQRVAASVGGELVGARPQRASAPSRDMAAYEAYLRGNGVLPLRTVGGLRQAVAEYERATTLDPRSCPRGPAWRWRTPPASSGRTRSPHGDGTRSWRRGCGPRRGARSAQCRGVGGACVHAHDAHSRTLEGVQDAFDRAFALAPHNAEAWAQYGDFLTLTGRPGHLEALQKALEYEPGRPLTLLNVAAFVGGEESLELADSAIALAPTLPNSYALRARMRLSLRGDTAGARRDVETALAPRHADGQEAADYEVALPLLSGDSATARAVIAAALERYRAVPVLVFSEAQPLATLALSLLHDREAAMDVLSRVAPRDVRLYRLLGGAWAAPLGSDPRIGALLEASPPPWVASP